MTTIIFQCVFAGRLSWSLGLIYSLFVIAIPLIFQQMHWHIHLSPESPLLHLGGQHSISGYSRSPPWSTQAYTLPSYSTLSWLDTGHSKNLSVNLRFIACCPFPNFSPDSAAHRILHGNQTFSLEGQCRWALSPWSSCLLCVIQTLISALMALIPSGRSKSTGLLHTTSTSISVVLSDSMQNPTMPSPEQASVSSFIVVTDLSWTKTNTALHSL